jgi:hypothetical protein
MIYTPLSAYRSGSAGMMVVICAYLFHSDCKITSNNRYLQNFRSFFSVGRLEEHPLALTSGLKQVNLFVICSVCINFAPDI